MKDDFISRAVALDALGERPTVWTDNDDYALGERNQYDMDRLAIETVPSVDAVPVVHGWWINGKCDKCGGHAPFWAMATTYYPSNFCPHCGARMRGEHHD